jgi:HSP20 family protein
VEQQALKEGNDMMITRWSPNRDLTTLQEEMDRLFQSLLPASARGGNGPESTWAPPADIRESADAYLVRMDLPGIDPKNVNVSVHDKRLTVRGERREKTEDKSETWHRVERYHGTFERSFELDAVAADRISASYRDGVLEITIPKSEAAKPREIQINVQKA